MAVSALGKVRLAARAALEKKAQALQALDLHAISGIADYFVLATGTSTTHLRTLSDAVEALLKREGHPVHHREGEPVSGWILLDYGDVVVHLFLPELRAFYALDRLWGDAPEVPLDP